MDDLKVGDLVIITTNADELNMYMSIYSGQIAKITKVKKGHNGGQIAKIDIDNGTWSWYYNDKLNQIYKL